MLTEVAALIQVVLIDLALAGDNAVAVALAAAALPAEQRKRVIFWGIAAALVLRVGFALITTQLLQIPGLLVIGGLLLIWVAWRMWRDISAHDAHHEAAIKAAPNFMRALISIIIADVSMSLDNVLAVAGVAREAPFALIFGLVLSVVLMGVAAGFISHLLAKYRWLAMVGVAIILVAAAQMIWEGMPAALARLDELAPGRLPTWLRQVFPEHQALAH